MEGLMDNNSFKAFIPSLVAMGASMAGLRDPLVGIDIKAEYKLIQKKESRLSANERRLVAYRYEREFKGIDGGANA